MPDGPLRVGALYVSGLFVVLYVAIIAQFVWICGMNEELDNTGYVPFFGSHFRVVSALRYERTSSSLPRCMFKTEVAVLVITGDSLMFLLICSF
jgi:hypothetical protein